MLIKCYAFVSYFVSRKAALIFGWMIFAYVAYETSKVQIDFTEFDPYTELGIDRVSAFASTDSSIIATQCACLVMQYLTICLSVCLFVCLSVHHTDALCGNGRAHAA